MILINSSLNNKLLFWLSFFMVFPSFTIFGTQVATFLLLFFFFKNQNLLFRFKFNFFSWLALSLVAASIISVIDTNAEKSVDISLIVLPNYILWFSMIFFLPNLLQRINFYHIYKGISFGLGTLLMANIFNDFLKSFVPFLRFPDNNGFAYMAIVFSPIVFYYLNSKKKIYFYLFSLTILFALLLFERRAGFVIVGLEFILFHSIKNINFKSILKVLLIGLLLISVLQFQSVRNYIFGRSERIYSLLYQREESKLTDQSELVRKAMVEKGLIIFREHPLTGIGLNNFIDYDVSIPLNFEGGEILRSKNLSQKSAHNSYVAFLTGGGLFLFIPLIIMFVLIGYKLVINISSFHNYQIVVLLGFIGMIIHLYYISAIINIFTWFYISIAITYSLRYKIIYRDPSSEFLTKTKKNLPITIFKLKNY